MKLSSILGHRAPLDVLRRSLESDRPSHAYLFHGPEGVGKERTALAFAASLLCEAREGPEACGACDACHKLERQLHADLELVLPEDQAVARKLKTKSDFDGKPSATIRVATVRRLNAWLAGRPVEGARRVAVVVDAHRMGTEGQNALLKTLEEPREGRTLVLVTASPSALLATVRSRCQKIRFGWLGEDELVALLGAQGGVDAEGARAIAARAGGSASRALALAARSDDTAAKMREALGTLDPRRPTRVLDLAEGLKGDRERAVKLVDVVLEHLGDRLRGSSADPARVTRQIAYATDTRRALAGGANISLAIEDLLFEMLSTRGTAR